MPPPPLPSPASLGLIHSIETASTTDGPGIRSVVFLQGCKLRCLYCHNPDTWPTEGGTAMLPSQLVALLERNLPYYRHSGGGVTVSGGEPTLQTAFLTQVFTLCKAKGISTAIDTSGYAALTPELDALLAATDLVLLDVKEARPEQHKHLCGGDLATVKAFLAHCVARQQRLWVRHVLVPEYTLEPASVEALAELLAPVWPHLEKLEFLPYHRLGEHKWAELGKTYPLAGTPPVTPEQVAQVQAWFEAARLACTR